MGESAGVLRDGEGLRKVGTMRRREKEQLLQYLQEMGEMQKQLRNKDLPMEDLLGILQQLQSAGYEVGTAIEQSEGEGTRTVSLLEDYCEVLYQYSEKAGSSWDERLIDLEKLDQGFQTIQDSLVKDIPCRTEVVFLPCKASLWKSMEDIWKATRQHADCHAVVMPIPYFDKNPDGSLGEEHLERSLMPDDVETVPFEEYHLQEAKPDVIFFSNPYDRDHKTMSVDPAFYSDQLKQYTDCLICVPDEEQAIGAEFARTTGIFNADLVLVSTEEERKNCVGNLTELTGEETRTYWENKIRLVKQDELERVLGTGK